MVRNSQFRFETFNTSYSEIDGQIDAINSRRLSDGVPDYILAIIDNLPGASVNSKTPTNTILLPIYTPAAKPSNTEDYIDQTASQTYNGICRTFGAPLGAGAETIRCSQIEIESNADLAETDIGSDQNQTYEYRTLGL